MPAVLLTLLLLLLSQPLAAQTASTYADSAAREHVRLARERRQTADVSVESYQALSKERISVNLRALRRDRLLYRREVAGRLQWTREGPAHLEVLGAREMIPVAIKGIQIPSDLTSFMPHLAFDPADNLMLLAWDDDGFVRHPLAPNGEDHYRYRTGSTTSIQLQDGRIVRLVELEIIPLRADPHLIRGSFWLDAETHAVVQAAFRLARKIDLRDEEEEDPDADEDDIPAWLGEMTAELEYVTIDYGLYDLRWWMPRLIAFEGVVRAGPMRLPLLYERTYSDYEIVGSPTPVAMSRAEMVQRDSVRALQEEQCQGSMQVRVGDDDPATPDSIPSGQEGRCGRWTVTMSTDTAAIMNSPLLPANPFDSGEQLLSEQDINELKEQFEDLVPGPMMLPRPEVRYSLFDPGMLRYNRVEGLSVGSSANVDFGKYVIDANARIGLADLQPNFELSVTKPAVSSELTAGVYRRLNGTDPFARPFALGSSLSSLLFGRDDHHFYRSLGVELRGEPTGAGARWYAWRLYAQRETAAEVETEFSLRHLINEDHTFAPNVLAEAIDVIGAEATLRYQRGLDPTGFRFAAELYGNGAGGGRTFGRSALTLRFGIPLPGAFDAATEYAVGGSMDALPPQHHWYLGGSSTLRGYHAGTMVGESFWRGRGEIAYGLPMFRLIGFTDVGWAGDMAAFSNSRPLLSVGAGLSALDGILRFDVARGLREPKGWTASLYFDAAL